MTFPRQPAEYPGHVHQDSDNENQSNNNQTDDESSPQSIDNERIASYAMWTEAFGTFISALGSNPSLNSQISNDLNIVGNSIQAVSTGVVADTEETWNINKLGNIIDTIGLIEEASGSIFNITNQTTQLIIFLQGNLIQALANSLTTLYSLEQTPTLPNIYGFYGNATELSGLFIEILGEVIRLRNNSQATNVTRILNIIGNWVQVAGAVISAVGQSLTYEEAIQQNIDSTNGYATQDRTPSPYY